MRLCFANAACDIVACIVGVWCGMDGKKIKVHFGSMFNTLNTLYRFIHNLISHAYCARAGTRARARRARGAGART